jgi:hypothetical protein
MGRAATRGQGRRFKKTSLRLQVAERLSAFIDGYKSVLMGQTNAPVDPAGFPRNFNDTWMPWLPDDYQSICETHPATSEAPSCRG